MRVWIYQDTKQKRKKGPKNAAWYCGWLDFQGKRRCKSCGTGSRGKNAAEKLKRKLEAELLTGTYENRTSKPWASFRREYEQRVGLGLSPGTSDATRFALNHFERIVKPKRVGSITTNTIDEFIATRRLDKGQRGGKLSPATLNKDLRHLRAVLNFAQEWGYLSKKPRFRFERVPKKLPTYVTPDDFARIYAACHHATRPDGLPGIATGDWWKALLILAFMTGWRIGQMLQLRWSDVDLSEGTAISRAEDNKGKRDVLVPLHELVVDHLRVLERNSSNGSVFPFYCVRRFLWIEFQRIQSAAGIKQNGKNGGWCGFHDLRRAFAKLNAAKMDVFTLQNLMQHQSLQTTQHYVNLSNQLQPSEQ